MRAEQPFWFWNGEITKPEIARQIALMHEGGVGGFFLHPRQGMDLPYMSKAFLEHVRYAVECAKGYGMQVWLYDEYPYPSGVAGGELLLEPSYRAQNLFRYAMEAVGGQEVSYDIPWGKIILAMAYPMTQEGIDWERGIDLREDIGIIYETEIFQQGRGLTEYNQKRFFTGGHAKRLLWDAPQGQWAIRIFIQREADHFKYFGGFADPLNKEAMRSYLDLIHERYAKALGDEFGKTVRGIFTDEVAPFAGGDIAWSPLLPEEFQKVKGYDLVSRLPLLFEAGRDAAKVRYDYHDVTTQMFIEAFDKPVGEWCRAHGLLYTGEKPHLRGEQIGTMHLPGCDTGHQKAGDAADLFGTSFRSSPKTVASYAYFCGNGTALCEAYHSVGWGMTLRDMRWMADWIGIQGIDLFVPHAFYFSTSALHKHDAPPSEFACMPWWKHNRLYAAHLDRMHRLQQGQRKVELLLLDPSPSLFTAGEGRMNAAARSRGWENFCEVQKELVQAQLDYYVIDRDLLAQCSVQDGKIVLHGECFQCLVIPPMEAFEKESLEVLRDLVDGGADVRLVGNIPHKDIGCGSPKEAFSALCGKGLHREVTAATLAADLAQKYAAVYLRVLDEVPGQILTAQFEGEDAERLILANTSRQYFRVTLAWEAQSEAYSWEEDDGTRTQANYTLRDGKKRFLADFAPFETKVLTTLPGDVAYAADASIQVNLGHERPMKTASPNLLRLGLWDTVFDGKAVGKTEPKPIVDQLEAMGAAVPTRVVSTFGCDKEYGFAGMEVSYSMTFVQEHAGERRLWMEKGAVSETLSVLVNGTDVRDRWQQGFLWNVNDAFCDVSDLLILGENTVTVCGSVQRAQEGLINSLYLAGDFGCWKKDGLWHLAEPSKTGTIGDRIACGLPFYAGDILYDLGETAYSVTRYELEHWIFEDAAELFADGQSLGVRAWNPYRWEVKGEGRKLTLAVSTSLLAAFEGKHFDPEAHCMMDPEA